MPKYTIYIKNDDDAKWQAIADKPEWLHVALNTSVVEMAINRTDKPLLEPYDAQKAKEREELAQLVTGDDVESVAVQFKKKPVPKDHSYEFAAPPGKAQVGKSALCEHFQPKGQCMVLECKYARGKKLNGR